MPLGRAPKRTAGSGAMSLFSCAQGRATTWADAGAASAAKNSNRAARIRTISPLGDAATVGRDVRPCRLPANTPRRLIHLFAIGGQRGAAEIDRSADIEALGA